jgi:CMP-2-keto-3-deoxyoctulosonic acid synthetase
MMLCRLGPVDAGSLLITRSLTNTLLYQCSNANLLIQPNYGREVLQDQRCKVLQDAPSVEEMISNNGSKIVITDASASNGTVHAIDKVMPTEQYCCISTSQVVVAKSQNQQFLAAAVKIRIVAATLSDPTATHDTRQQTQRSRISNL